MQQNYNLPAIERDDELLRDRRARRLGELMVRADGRNQNRAARIRDDRMAMNILFEGGGMPMILRPGMRGMVHHRHADDDRIEGDLLDRLNEMYLRDNEKPLSKNILDQLPRISYKKAAGKHEESKEDDSLENSKCSVCLCQYEENDKLLLLTCFHKFHESCISSWF